MAKRKSSASTSASRSAQPLSAPWARWVWPPVWRRPGRRRQAPQGGVFAAAQRNLDDAETLATAAASNLVVVQKQSRIATAEADRVVRATDTALRQSRERQASAATQVAAEQSAQSAAIMIRATSDALSAAATATSLGNANAAQATAVAIQATATANMIENTNAQRAAEWEQNVMLPARMIGLILLGAIGLFLCLRYGIQAVEALILHIRVVKDGRGNIMVIMPPDGQGRQQMVMPHLTMDPVMSLTPPGFAQTTVSSSWRRRRGRPARPGHRRAGRDAERQSWRDATQAPQVRACCRP